MKRRTGPVVVDCRARYRLTVDSSGGRYTAIELDPVVEGLRINFGPAMCDAIREMAVRLARMCAGTPSSLANATQWDPRP